MHVHGINKNHLKDGCSQPLPSVLCYELPLNIKIILVLIVVPTNGTRGTVLGLYNHRHIENSLHQLRLQIITLLHQLMPPNKIEGPFSSGRFGIPNKRLTILVETYGCNRTNTIMILINAYQFFVVSIFM